MRSEVLVLVDTRGPLGILENLRHTICFKSYCYVSLERGLERQISGKWSESWSQRQNQSSQMTLWFIRDCLDFLHATTRETSLCMSEIGTPSPQLSLLLPPTPSPSLSIPPSPPPSLSPSPSPPPSPPPPTPFQPPAENPPPRISEILDQQTDWKK